MEHWCSMTLTPLHPIGVLWPSSHACVLCPPPTPALVFYGPHPVLLFQSASTLVCPARTGTQLERLRWKTLPALQPLSEHCSYFCLREISKGWRVTAAPNSCQILRRSKWADSGPWLPPAMAGSWQQLLLTAWRTCTPSFVYREHFWAVIWVWAHTVPIC